MACGGCGRRKRTRKTISMYSKKETGSNYIENQNGLTTTRYKGTHRLRARGCASGHIYLFAKDSEFPIDSNDFDCFVSRWPELFEEVKIDITSNNGKREDEFPKTESEVSEGNESLYENSF